jgi:hypothetical protein
MKLKKNHRCPASWVLAALLLMLTGCLPEHVVWSPDGKQAVVLGEKGLYLCDAEGRLSTLLVPDVVAAEWFSDSRRLALVRSVKLKSWAELQPLLPVETRERVAKEGNAVFEMLKSGKEFNSVLIPMGPAGRDFSLVTGQAGRDFSLVCVYLRSLAGVKELMGENWDFLQAVQEWRSDLYVGTLADGKMVLGPPLASGHGMFVEPRANRQGTAIVFASSPGDGEDLTLKVVPVDGSLPAQLVAEHAAEYPDWSVDGMSLLYMNTIDAAGNGRQLLLGSLARRRVLNQSGKIELQSGQDDLAGLLFYQFNKVRCLPDGRIIFSAQEVHLPATDLDMPAESQLYALDPDKQVSLTPLIPNGVRGEIPAKPVFFEISPDGRLVAVAGGDGQVTVVTLATAKTETIQPGLLNSQEFSCSAPVWRSTNELCFVSIQTTNNVRQPAQIALWSPDKTRILSSSWGADVRKGWLDK